MSSLDNPIACQQDARILGASGVTLLRALLESTAPLAPDVHRACMDAFYANGVAMAWLDQGPTGGGAVVDDPAWTDQWWQNLERKVDLVSDHPVTLFWVVGNEVEIQSPSSGPAWYGQKGGRRGVLDELAERLSEADPHHLIGTSLAHLNVIGSSNAPNVDFWGVNTYGTPHDGRYSDPLTDATGWLSQHLANMDERPYLITEWGADRLRCLRDVDSQVHGDLNQILQWQPPWRTWLCAPGSGDDAAAHRSQGDWNVALWEDVTPVLSGPDNPSGPFFGGTYFMSTDWWWFTLGVITVGSTTMHETTGRAWGATYDQNFNPEFVGLMYAQERQATEPRMTTIGLDKLAAAWTTSPPEITDVAFSVASCVATVTWTTSEPSTSEVQSALDGADPNLYQDTTIFRHAAYSPASTTTHELTVDLLPGLPHRVAGRSWTGDGRHATTGPLFVPGCTPDLGVGTAANLFGS